MKLAYIAPTRVPSQSANSQHVMRMAQAYGRLGHDVTLTAAPGAAAPGNDPFAFYGVERAFRLRLLPMPGFPGGGHVFALRAAAAVAADGPDIVHTRNVPTAYRCTRRGLPTILETHVPVADMGIVPRRQFEHIRRSKALRGVVVISRALHDWYERTYSDASEWLVLAPDAADPPATTTIARRDGPPVVAYTGSLYPGKGMELLAAIVPRCPALRFRIVGGPDDLVAHWRAQLRGAANVEFLGFVPFAVAERERLAADILVAPYQPSITLVAKGTPRLRWLGGHPDIAQWMSPLKLFEYMAAGKPIVCSDLDVLREVLRDGDNAVLAPHDRLDTWAAALSALASDPERGRRLGGRARAEFLERYTWDARARHILAAAQRAEGWPLS